VFNSPAEGFPWDDLREIFSGCQWMATVPNAVEILPKIWTAWVGCTSVTDRQTTDARAIAYSERECEFTFAKNLLLQLLLYTLSQKTPTFKLSVTLSNLNRFSKFRHWWKAYESWYKTHIHLTLGMLLHYLGKIKLHIFYHHFWPLYKTTCVTPVKN